MKFVRIIFMLAVCLAVAASAAAAYGETTRTEVSWVALIADLVAASGNPSDQAFERIDADTERMQDPVALSVAEHWKKVWADPDYRLYMYGTDDPAEIPVTGRHAFVVLGYALQNGGMADELIGRCDAAAAAALAFPESVLVCSGGATGGNNPERNTEAGLMKAYLTEKHGIAPERIFTDERAMTTEENARNTLAILQEQQIETITIVTSSYHQKWGQTLYNAMSARYRQNNGYSVEIVGNWCWPVKKGEFTERSGMKIAVRQMCSILELPADQIARISELFR